MIEFGNNSIAESFKMGEKAAKYVTCKICIANQIRV